MAITRIRLIYHSDQGSQYTSENYQKTLNDHGLRCSMSKKGDPWDNAPMESFFSALKTELVRHRKYKNRIEARSEIFEYIKVFYNRIRIQLGFCMKSPESYEAEYIIEVAEIKLTGIIEHSLSWIISQYYVTPEWLCIDLISRTKINRLNPVSPKNYHLNCLSEKLLK